MTPTPDPIKTVEEIVDKISTWQGFRDEAMANLPKNVQEFADSTSWAGEELDAERKRLATQAINNELTRARENTGMKYANGEPILLGDTVDVPYITPMGDLTDDIDEEKRAEVVFDKGLFGLKYPYHVTPLRDYCRKTKGEYISNYGEVTIWSDNTVLVKAAIKSSGGVTPPIQQSQTEGGE